MTIETTPLSNELEKLIVRIQQKTQMPRNEILEEYQNIIDDPFIKEDAQLTDDNVRERHASMILWNRLTNRLPVKSIQIITAGIGPTRVFKSGKVRAEAMALIKGKTAFEPRTLVFSDRSTLKSKSELSIYSGYTVKLGESATTGDLFADDRADFSSPIATNLTFAKVLQMMKVQRVPELSQVDKYISRLDDKGYTVSTDWKLVSGLVSGYFRGPHKELKDIEMGSYTLVDFSTSNDSDGQRPGLYINCAPELIKWGRDSELECVGTLSSYVDKNKIKKYSMNAYLINPIVGIPIPSEE